MEATISNRQLEIIEAAGRILCSAGVSGLTTKNLAAEMKFSESALYRHFRNKEEIIISLLRHIADELEERYSLVIDPEASPIVQFRAIFTEKFRFFQANPNFAVAVFSEGLMTENEKVNTAIGRIMELKKKTLTPIIEQGRKTGAFRKDLSAEMILHITMGAVRLQMFKWRVAGFEFDLRKKGKSLIDSILKLITT